MANNKLTLNRTANARARQSTREIAGDLFTIMKGHVGQDNGITRDELFSTVFGAPRKRFNQMQQFALNLLLLRVIHYLRVRSNCFIVSRRNDKTWEYFVLKNDNDLDLYHDDVDGKIHGLKMMKKRASKAVSEGWHKQKWEIAKK